MYTARRKLAHVSFKHLCWYTPCPCRTLCSVWSYFSFYNGFSSSQLTFYFFELAIILFLLEYWLFILLSAGSFYFQTIATCLFLAELTFVLTLRPLWFSFRAICKLRSKKPPTFIISCLRSFSVCVVIRLISCLFFSFESCGSSDEVDFLLRPTQIMLLHSPRQNCLFPVLCRNACFVLFHFGNGHRVTLSIQTKVTNSVITKIIQMGPL